MRLALLILVLLFPVAASADTSVLKGLDGSVTTADNSDGCGAERAVIESARRRMARDPFYNEGQEWFRKLVANLDRCVASAPARAVAAAERARSAEQTRATLTLLANVLSGIAALAAGIVLWRYIFRPAAKGALTVAGATHALISKHPVERVLPHSSLDPIDPFAYKRAMHAALPSRGFFARLFTPAFVDENQIAHAKRAKAKAEQHVELNTTIIKREMSVADAKSEQLYHQQVNDEQARYNAERQRLTAEHEAKEREARRLAETSAAALATEAEQLEEKARQLRKAAASRTA